MGRGDFSLREDWARKGPLEDFDARQPQEAEIWNSSTDIPTGTLEARNNFVFPPCSRSVFRESLIIDLRVEMKVQRLDVPWEKELLPETERRLNDT